jgi:hypothetical protein
MIEIALVLGAVDAMICFEHAVSYGLGAIVAGDRGSIAKHDEARIDVSIFVYFCGKM